MAQFVVYFDWNTLNETAYKRFYFWKKKKNKKRPERKTRWNETDLIVI